MISSALVDAILSRAAAEPKREVCGLLLGLHHEITGMIPTANVSPDPAAGFEVDPAALFAAHRAARAGGPAVIGPYHSHPNGCCEPSARDAASAVPGQLWLIVASGKAALFRMGRDGIFSRCAMINARGPGCESAPHSPEGPPRGHG